LNVETLDMNDLSDKSITFKGGDVCNYLSIIGATVISWNVTINNGTVIIENGTIEIE
jgi:hypothetical protein